MLIRVFGSGCAKCKEAEDIVRSAVQEAKADASVEKVTDFMQMMACGVLSTPAVAIGDKVLCSGRVPSKREVLEWIARV